MSVAVEHAQIDGEHSCDKGEEERPGEKVDKHWHLSG